jgi:methionyl-tRNA formyltransferase
LPEYRGGSPIQNQIIDGLEESAVSLFKMGSGLDDGPIYKQKKISLLGNLDDVFMEITKKSIPITKELIKDYLNDSISLTVQDETKASSFKRRKKEQSEITLEEIKTKSSKYLYNKVRSLQDPYPNAYIVCGDGKKLYIQCVKIDESE